MPLSVGQLDTLSQHNYPVDTNLGLCSSSYYLDDGTFSSVVRVRHAESGELYAAKVVDKLLIMKNNKAAAVMAEKSILLSLSHENVVKLYSTFQDATSLCIESIVAVTVNLFRFYFGVLQWRQLAQAQKRPLH